MAAVADGELVAVVHVRLDVVAERRRFRQPGKHVERGERTRRVLDACGVEGHARAQAFEQLDLALEDALVGAQNFLFIFLQRGRDEPLAAGDRLLTVVVARHRVKIRLRDFDVVTEDAVVADLQRANPRPCALALLELGDHLFARTADAPEVVDLGVETVADVAAVADERPGLVDQAAIDVVAHVSEIVELAEQRADERCFARPERHARAGYRRNRLLQSDQVARPGAAERRPGDQALEVLHRFQHLAELAAVGAAERKFFHRIKAVANAIEGHERAQQPRPKQPSRHRRHGAVDFMEQRTVPSAFERFHHFEMFQCDRINQEVVGGRFVCDAADVRELGFLRVAQVVEQRPSRTHCSGMGFEAETLEAVRAELIEQRPPRRFALERPGLDACDDQAFTGALREDAGQVEIDGRDDLARPKHRHFVGERLKAIISGVFGAGKFPGRQIEQCHAPDARIAGSKRQQECRLARVEKLRIGESPGRHDADDGAFDDPFGLFRVFDLIADGDAKTFLHKPRKVRVERVMGHAAHGNGAALTVFSPRREREFERPRGDERVLVEHLVEIAHAEKENGVAILLLRVEILAHGRRDGRGGRRGTRGGGHVEWNVTCSCWHSTPQLAEAASRSRGTARLWTCGLAIRPSRTASVCLAI